MHHSVLGAGPMAGIITDGELYKQVYNQNPFPVAPILSLPNGQRVGRKTEFDANSSTAAPLFPYGQKYTTQSPLP